MDVDLSTRTNESAAEENMPHLPNIQSDTDAVAPVELLRVEDAARVLSIGRSRVYELLRNGDLQSVKIGSSRRITRAALRAFVTGLDSYQSI